MGVASANARGSQTQLVPVKDGEFASDYACGSSESPRSTVTFSKANTYSIYPISTPFPYAAAKKKREDRIQVTFWSVQDLHQVVACTLVSTSRNVHFRHGTPSLWIPLVEFLLS